MVELFKSIDEVDFTGKLRKFEFSEGLLDRGSELILMERLLDEGTEDLNLR